MDKIRIAIAGYGNIGRGVEQAVTRNPDMTLAAVVTRRSPDTLRLATPGVAVVAEAEVEKLVGDIDVMMLCGGSATDLPKQGPRYAGLFNTVDSFDTHAAIPGYFAAMDKASGEGGKLSLISCGWDPGLFSIMRAYGSAVLPQGESYTFWGRGVSQGHSDAIRRIPGVKDAIQYTVPIDGAMAKVRAGESPILTTREKHTRLCYVVAEEQADKAAITRAIKEMPNYFSDYDTTVNFISQEELAKEHSAMPHGGFVFRSGETGAHGTGHVMEFSLKLGSNPEFTASVLAAYARAVFRMAQGGRTGCVTVLDIPPAMLNPKTPEELRKELL